ncbi:hypothetical protein LIER_05065 [Lithospermum erythrorhizon]|uniref:Uncharacterized protein n=1 Tax=Lithospermum erythrorhizon TaxID=34254 RepID=A0AAV3NZ37_LITER
MSLSYVGHVDPGNVERLVDCRVVTSVACKASSSMLELETSAVFILKGFSKSGVTRSRDSQTRQGLGRGLGLPLWIWSEPGCLRSPDPVWLSGLDRSLGLGSLRCGLDGGTWTSPLDWIGRLAAELDAFFDLDMWVVGCLTLLGYGYVLLVGLG